MKNIGNAFNMYLIWTDRLSYLLKHLRTTIILHILACFQINEIDESKLKSIFISIKIDNKYSTNTLYMCRGRMPFLVNIINLRNDLSNLWTFMKVIRASMLVINSVIYLVIVQNQNTISEMEIRCYIVNVAKVTFQHKTAYNKSFTIAGLKQRSEDFISMPRCRKAVLLLCIKMVYIQHIQ